MRESRRLIQWLRSRKDLAQRFQPQSVKLLLVAAFATLSASFGFANAQAGRQAAMKGSVRRARLELQQFRHSEDTNGADLEGQQRRVARSISPSDYEYLVVHDQDIAFRRDALADFGSIISPVKTLGTLAYLAQNDRDRQIRILALTAITQSFESGRLPRQTKTVEQLADRCLHDRYLRYISIRMLAFCGTPTAKATLRHVIAGNYDAAEKKIATEGLDGQLRRR